MRFTELTCMHYKLKSTVSTTRATLTIQSHVFQEISYVRTSGLRTNTPTILSTSPQTRIFHERRPSCPSISATDQDRSWERFQERLRWGKYRNATICSNLQISFPQQPPYPSLESVCMQISKLKPNALRSRDLLQAAHRHVFLRGFENMDEN